MDIRAERVFHNVSLQDLGQIRDFVRETGAAGNCEAAVMEELVVAVNEATANIVRHGYDNDAGEIKVTVICSSEWIKVKLLDACPGFDPTSVPSPDTMLPLEERPFGGMGVHMMRTFCDELSYRRDSGGGNELILLKRIGDK
jgi:anti-sigma regulatory factor (Ser/Thr protein kinase)